MRKKQIELKYHPATVIYPDNWSVNKYRRVSVDKVYYKEGLILSPPAVVGTLDSQKVYYEMERHNVFGRATEMYVHIAREIEWYWALNVSETVGFFAPYMVKGHVSVYDNMYRNPTRKDLVHALGGRTKGSIDMTMFVYRRCTDDEWTNFLKKGIRLMHLRDMVIAEKRIPLDSRIPPQIFDGYGYNPDGSSIYTIPEFLPCRHCGCVPTVRSYRFGLRAKCPKRSECKMVNAPLAEVSREDLISNWNVTRGKKE
jgi:hypothetical protein